MSIHRNYARLSAHDRRVVDAAFDAARAVFVEAGRKVSNSDPAERMIEAMATFMIDSGGAARVASGSTFTAPEGAQHESYGL
jgi:hypothetical protein